jgi:hypothetical protein
VFSTTAGAANTARLGAVKTSANGFVQRKIILTAFQKQLEDET